MSFRAFAVFVALLLPNVSFGQDVTAWPCEACSATQMRNLAISKGIGYRHIYSLQQGVIINYLVERLDTDEAPMDATPYPPEDWIIDQFAGIRQFYVNSGNQTHGVIAASAMSETGGSVDAYDIVESSVDRTRVSNVLANHPWLAFTSSMASFGRAIRLAGVATPDVPLTVTVNFPDTSSVIFQFNWNLKRWEYVKGTARDSHGNIVPESAADFTNGDVGSATFDFSGGSSSDYENFVRRASAYGIPVIGGRGVVGCVKVGTTVECRVY